LARIRDATGREVRLLADTGVGRGRRSTLFLDNSWVSGNHARIRWNGSHWEVRDLGSTNGTFVNHRKLTNAEWCNLTRGDTIGFGRMEFPWQLVDEAPPSALAVSADATIDAREGVIGLPDPNDPEVVVFQRDDGQWMVERGDQVEAAHDGDVLEAGRSRWTLHLPEAIEATRDVRAKLVSQSKVVFRVSQDEEHIEVELHGDHGVDVFPFRAHHELLLNLARARLADAADPNIAPGEYGWRYQDKIARDSSVPPQHFNMTIHRARHQLREAGFVDADDLFERRRGAGMIRIGCAGYEIAPFDR
jgi:hypothetical protein